jgi:hypothetical protein
MIMLVLLVLLVWLMLLTLLVFLQWLLARTKALPRLLLLMPLFPHHMPVLMVVQRLVLKRRWLGRSKLLRSFSQLLSQWLTLPLLSQLLSQRSKLILLSQLLRLSQWSKLLRLLRVIMRAIVP